MTQRNSIPRIVIAGAASNVGKTTITSGIISCLRARGLIVQPFKCGPDYIDPSYHGRAAGRPCRNLDTWMLNDEQLKTSFQRACADADVAVIEGVMGLFDGSNWQDERGSTAQIAKLLESPVILVVDIAGAARSAAVSVLGCQHFDPNVGLRAVVLNFAGSESHATGCGEAITQITGLPTLGWLPRHNRLKIPERHLGLVPGGEHTNADALIAEVAAEVASRFDVDRILEIGRNAPNLPAVSNLPPSDSGNDPRLKGAKSDNPILAVARDEAFCFYYPENLELLAEAGAMIEYFSPLRGEAPSGDAAGVYLGGGYPELHGEALSSNAALWRRLAELRAKDAPIFAECGGFMVLTQALIDGQGRHWPMAGLLPGVAQMSENLAALGYRHATAIRPNLLAETGDALRGHEFRYSHWVIDAPRDETSIAWHAKGTRRVVAEEKMGYVSGNLLASYLHIHFGQRPELAQRFVQRLRHPNRN